MPKAIPIEPEAVGLAFQQMLGAALHFPNKRARKSEFIRLKSVLTALRLIPTNFDLYTLAWGVDRNGDQTIVATGVNRKPPATTDSSK